MSRDPAQPPLRPRRPNVEHPGWGGFREGAGRKKKAKRSVPHRARPEHKSRHPVHVTLRMTSDLGHLRTKSKLRAVKAAIRRTTEAREEHFRVVHFSLQSTHLHLLIEAKDKDALSRGLRALEISLARRLNAAVGRKGPTFTDRYHAHALATPREVRNALAYVLLNSRRHSTSRSEAAYLDPCSSAATFDGWSRRCAYPPGHVDEDTKPCTAAPRTWLLTKGWRAHHALISPTEVPGPL